MFMGIHTLIRRCRQVGQAALGKGILAKIDVYHEQKWMSECEACLFVENCQP